MELTLQSNKLRELTLTRKKDNIIAGTKIGGRKAAQKNLERDPDFYKNIGRKGGKNGNTGGFASSQELARLAGAKGGRISRRRKPVPCPHCGVLLTGASVIEGVLMGNPDAMCDNCFIKKFKETK